jgi:YggT family protein
MFLGIFSLLLLALRVVEFAVLGYVIAGWLGLGDDNPVVRILRVVAEPLLRIARPIARRIPGPLDWSPMLVLLGLYFVRRLITGI